MAIYNMLLAIPMPYRNIVVYGFCLVGAWVLYRFLVWGMEQVERWFRL
jgi:hypothetical protein